ncbi:MAG: zinc metallopeptidase [Gemmataceae bacterium]
MVFGIDPLYFLIVGPAMLLAAWAQWKVQSAYQEANRFASRSGVTGAETAAVMLEHEGIQNAKIEMTQGFLSDHYVPGERLLRLSSDVYHGHSLAALGIAAHETGHAFQDANRYPLLIIRNAIVPLASFGSSTAWVIFFIGVFLGWANLVIAGIVVFSFVVAFQLANLPVEYDASRRARIGLLETGLISPEEDKIVAKVLNAAALTYVAATLSSVLTLLYFIVRSGLLSRNRE